VDITSNGSNQDEENEAGDGMLDWLQPAQPPWWRSGAKCFAMLCGVNALAVLWGVLLWKLPPIDLLAVLLLLVLAYFIGASTRRL